MVQIPLQFLLSLKVSKVLLTLKSPDEEGSRNICLVQSQNVEVTGKCLLVCPCLTIHAKFPCHTTSVSSQIMSRIKCFQKSLLRPSLDKKEDKALQV